MISCSRVDDVRERVAFGDSVVASISSGSSDLLERLPVDAKEFLNETKELAKPEFRRILVDETWGVVELGYCFSSGVFLYMTLPTSDEPPEILDLHIYGAESELSKRCALPGDAA